MKPILIFDFDGTLVDSISTIVESLVNAAKALDVVLCPKSAQHVIGLGLPQATHYLFPNADEAFHAAFIEGYRKEYIAKAHLPKPYEGIQELLDQLKELSIPMAVATGKTRVGLDRAFNYTNWSEYFLSTRTADKTASKPNPQMIYEILDEINHQGQPVYMIGDTTHDLGLGHNAGAQSIGVTYGAHSRDQLELEKPYAIVDDVSELKALLFSLVK